MADTSLSGLKQHLFQQLERISNGNLTAEELEAEVSRTEAIVSLADQVTEASKMQLTAAKLFAEHGQGVLHMLPQIGKATE